MGDLRANLPGDVLDRFTIGYGVVFPDCEWRSAGAERDSAMLADMRHSRDLEGWLRGLFEYWRARDGEQGQPDDDALRRLQEYLRPDVDTIPANEVDARLFHQVEDAGRRIERYTDDQMRMADVAEANPRVLCAGGAGTGKTFLAERLAGPTLVRSRRTSRIGMPVPLAPALPRVADFDARTGRLPD